ncbi:MAG: Txe/YoeB family addiction module toxin [Spirochaetota bacterium]|nr:Txe/YoeB family addiction module toxin [Spirochaetota bacterium]
MSWTLYFTRQAEKDAIKLKEAGLKEIADELLAVLKENPYQKPPAFKKLTGELSGLYSRRINIKHRLVYHVLKQEQAVKVIRMWSHYE